jgi:hypothetical protein
VFLPEAYWYCRRGVKASVTSASSYLLANVWWLP